VKLIERVDRCLDWIGTARTASTPNLSLIALSAALETILCERSDRLKAEALCLRSMLLPLALGEGFADPGILYGLYDVRSRLVHGSDSAASDDEVRTLLAAVARLLDLFLRLCAREQSAKTLRDLFTAVETEDHLRESERWLRASGYETIADAARRSRASQQ
jgi:hypothetical protein